MYSAGNEQKVPFGSSMNAWSRDKILQFLEMQGWSLPASIVSIVGPGLVIVKFEVTNCPYTLSNIMVPVVGNQYALPPYQVGEMGRVVPSDFFLSGVTGQTSGPVDFTFEPGPLGALAWEPLGNKAWAASPNPKAYVIQGPEGVIIQTMDGTVRAVVSETGIDLYPAAGETVTVHGDITLTGNLRLGGYIMNQAGTNQYPGDIRIGGNFIAGAGTADQVGLQTHNHPYVKPASGTPATPTGAPNAGT
jgi:hypothetical protein